MGRSSATSPGAARPHPGPRPRRSPRRKGALVALTASVALCAALAALAVPPPSSLEAFREPLSAPPDVMGAVWSGLGSAIPVAEHPARLLAVAVLLVVACGGASTWLSFQLFRGPGRLLAAVVAGPLTTVGLCSWLRMAQPAEAVGHLVFTLLATLTVAALIRPLVHLGRLTPIACARSLALATASAAVIPRAGLPLLVACAAVCILRGRRWSDRKASPPSASLSRATMAGSVWTILAAGLAIPVLAGVALWATDAQPARAWTWVTSVRPMAPPVDAIREHLNPYLIYPALALILLMVAPLRWRGGWSLVVLLTGALLVGDGKQTLAPMPVLITAITTAVCGWIWLAGTVLRSPRWAGRVLATTAAATLVWLGQGGAPRVQEPIATQRPAPAVAWTIQRGLTGAGDVLVIHDPNTLRQLRAIRDTEGALPNLTLVDAASLDAARTERLVAAWLAERRRILSDSFNLAGRARTRLVVEAGPLFWFSYDEEIADRRTPVELREAPDGASRAEQDAWNRIHLERARFRRAEGYDADAVLALPLDADRGSLQTAIRVSRSVNLPADTSTELPPSAELARVEPQAPLRAETGDLLFAAGEHDMGLRYLATAADAGYGPAWSAMVRWQLRAGRRGDADKLIETMLGQPQLRPALLDVLDWLIARDRLAEALALRERLGPDNEHAGPEMGTRLRLLHAVSR